MYRSKTIFASILMLSAFSFISGCASPPPSSQGYVLCGDTFCTDAEQCCNDACVPYDSNEHCGKCDNPCNDIYSCVMIAENDYQCMGCNGQACSETCCPGLTPAQDVCVVLNTSPNHCGECGNACGENQDCSQGQCVCRGGMELCGGKCVATTTVQNCGKCGETCPSAEDPSLNLASSKCGHGTLNYSCQIECKEGFEDANGNIKDGCEKALTASSRCGDGKAEGDELCDGSDFKGLSCLTSGYTGGTLVCSRDCDHIDDSACISEPISTCNNGNLDTGELCDGTYFHGSSECYQYSLETPGSVQYATGNLSCNENCTLNFDDCEAAQCTDGEKKCIGNKLMTCEDMLWPTTGGLECSGQTPTCDDASKACVGCLADSDCSTNHCDLSSKKCVECLIDDHCASGKTCDESSKTCQGSATLDWTEVVTSSGTFDKEHSELVGSFSTKEVMNIGDNVGAYNLGPWPKSTEVQFEKYLKITYDKSLYQGKSQIKVQFKYNINKNTGPAKFAIALYDGETQIGMKSFDTALTAQTAEYIQSMDGSLSDPHLRIAGYANQSDNGGTLRVFPLTIWVK